MRMLTFLARAGHAVAQPVGACRLWVLASWICNVAMWVLHMPSALVHPNPSPLVMHVVRCS